jgi:hypothetical protein
VIVGFFRAMAIPVMRGRDFKRDENETAPRVAIVDQTAGAHYCPVQIGRRFYWNSNKGSALVAKQKLLLQRFSRSLAEPAAGAVLDEMRLPLVARHKTTEEVDLRQHRLAV